MKFFQKILIGLCSLLPCFASVPSGSRGKTREIQKRNYQALVQKQADNVCNLKFFPSSSVSTTYNSVRSNYSFELGASFAMSPSPQSGTQYGCSILFGDIAPSFYACGFLLYSPLLDGVDNYVNQYRIFVKGFGGGWKGATSLSNYVFFLLDSAPTNILSTDSISCQFTLSSPYSTMDLTKGWYFILPFIVTKSVSSDVLSSVCYGLYQGFIGGLSYSRPQQEAQYRTGFDDGEASGLKKGYANGYEAGKAVADKQVYKNGYDKGYSDGSSTLTPATTIWSLFGAIASVPTEILNGMGGIAIWNTPILAVLFSLLFLAMVLWIIRKFI